MKRIIPLLFVCPLIGKAQKVYQTADSLRIENLLQKPITGDTILHFACQFIGTPYVAKTLDIQQEEKLIINTRQLDCTTFVETVLALAATAREGKHQFSDYCKNLERLRYFDGYNQGYLSRLHYFTWWIEDNTKRGNVKEVRNDDYFTATMTTNLFYMSKNPQYYPQIKKSPRSISAIAALEKKYSGDTVYYLPKQSVHLNQEKLTPLSNGDVIAIVTNKAGLDYSHLGFAVWGNDGQLHLLNASSIHKKVVEEPMTLSQYLAKSPSRIGIRCFRW